MKTYFSLLTFLCLFGNLMAQLDVGVNFLTVPKVQLSVEKNITEHFALIAGAGYGPRNAIAFNSAKDTLNQTTVIGFNNLPQNNLELDAFFGLRYYFFPDNQLKGLFTGASLMYQTTTWVDSEFFDQKPDDNFLIRVPIGYKWVSPKGFVLEAGCTLIGGKVLYGHSTFGNRFDVNVDFIGKVGYRFGHKSEN